MVSITKMKVLEKKRIQFVFDDGSEKIIDFDTFIGDDEMSKPLREDEYFRRVKLVQNGRGIFWPNEFDFCTDFLHDYKPKPSVSMTEKP